MHTYLKRICEFGLSVRLFVSRRFISCQYRLISMSLVYVIEVYRGMFDIENEARAIFSLTGSLKKYRHIMISGEKSFAVYFNDVTVFQANLN